VALSEHEQTVLDIPELDISVTFTRQQFESMMVDMLSDIDQIVDKVLLDANKIASEISVLIRTGGSSQIASVRDLMEAKFPGRVTEHDPFTSVATGLAIASYYGYQFE
ncbi:MAG: Hsp70 family protein, partial [Pseudomonadales bacterium]